MLIRLWNELSQTCAIDYHINHTSHNQLKWMIMALWNVFLLTNYLRHDLHPSAKGLTKLNCASIIWILKLTSIWCFFLFLTGVLSIAWHSLEHLQVEITLLRTLSKDFCFPTNGILAAGRSPCCLDYYRANLHLHAGTQTFLYYTQSDG